MNLDDILEVPNLENELRDIDKHIEDAARRGDIGTMNALNQRKKELPALIQQAQLREIGDRINEQRTRLSVFEFDLDKQRILSTEISSQFMDKLKELEQEKQRILNEVGQALRDKEDLEFAVSQEQRVFNQLVAERTRLLMSQVNS